MRFVYLSHQGNTAKNPRFLRKTLSSLTIAIIMNACGGTSYQNPQPEYAEPMSDEMTIEGAPSAEYEEVGNFMAAQEADDFEMAKRKPEAPRPEGKFPAGGPVSPSKTTDNPPDEISVDGESSDITERKATQTEPLVVYSGYLKLRVKRLLIAVDEISQIAKEYKGFIESLTQRVIVVRIPADDFEQVMKTFAQVGTLLERRVQALDVTAQYKDLTMRLVVAKDARERLLRLLKDVADLSERLRILDEVKRLSEQIESTESTLNALRDLVDFFTITIELEPMLANSAADVRRSPFEWIRGLAPHTTTLYDGKKEITMAMPDDYVLFDKSDVWLAQAADSSLIRAGRVPNEPVGDNRFWSEAIHFEMGGRDEQLVDQGKTKRLAYRLYQSPDVEPRFYLVAVSVFAENLYVLEAFFPNQEAFELHRQDVLKAVESFKVK